MKELWEKIVEIIEELLAPMPEPILIPIPVQADR